MVMAALLYSSPAWAQVGGGIKVGVNLATLSDFNDASRDRDSDGLSNLSESGLGTNPCGLDTDGDLVSDVTAGRSSLSTIKDEELPDNLRALKPEARMDEVNKQMGQRKALNEKLSTLVAKRDKYVADQRAKVPPKASSFDRVVEDTLKAQIKR